MGPRPFVTVRRLSATLRLAPLFVGKVEPVEVRADGVDLNLVRLARGRENWAFGGHHTGALSRLEILEVTHGRVELSDAVRQVFLSGPFEHHGHAAGMTALSVAAGGVIRGEPAQVTLNGPPLQGRPVQAVYPMSAHIQDGATQVQLDGQTRTPFDLRHFTFLARATGPNLADLRYLFSLLAPNSRAYVLSGQVRKDGPKLYFTGIKGRVGDSDVAGSANSDRSGARPMLRFQLRFNRLVREDVEAFMAPAPPHATARVHVGAAAPHPRDRLFSDKAFDLRRLRAADFDASLRVGALTGYEPALRDLDVRLTDVGGKLTADPVTFATEPGGGRLRLVFDGRREAPSLRIDAALRGARLASLRSTHPASVDGVLDIWLSAQGSGSSLAEIAASAGGRAAFRVAAGHLPKAQAAILGGDVVQGLGALFDKRTATAPLKCAVGEFDGARGALVARTLVLAAGNGEAVGSGEVDLRAQVYDLRLSGVPRAPGLFHRGLPISVTGPLNHPSAKLDLAREGGASAVRTALGVVLSPLEALAGRKATPAVTVDCARLLADAADYVRWSP